MLERPARDLFLIVELMFYFYMSHVAETKQQYCGHLMFHILNGSHSLILVVTRLFILLYNLFVIVAVYGVVESVCPRRY